MNHRYFCSFNKKNTEIFQVFYRTPKLVNNSVCTNNYSLKVNKRHRLGHCVLDETLDFNQGKYHFYTTQTSDLQKLKSHAEVQPRFDLTLSVCTQIQAWVIPFLG